MCSDNLSSGPIRAVCILAVVGLLFIGTPDIVAQTPADDQKNPDPASQPPATDDAEQTSGVLKIDVRKVYVRAFGGAAVGPGEVIVSLTVTNVGLDPLSADFSKFSLTCNGKPHSFRNPVGSGLSNPRVLLDPEKSQSGDIRFRVEFSPVKEPKLILSWQDGDHKVDVDLNDALRRLGRIEVQKMGPGNSLAVVELNRPLDHASIWHLSSVFHQLKREGFERVVLDVRAKSTATQSYTFKMTIGGWLASLRHGQQGRAFPFGAQVQSDVQFDRFFVTGIPDGTIRTPYGTTPVSIQRGSREDAVADALRTAYNNAPLKDALSDLKHAEPGVQRAAIEGCIDRLTEEQLFDLVRQTADQSAAMRSRLVGNLYRVPYPSVTELLKELIADKDSAVSEAATEALIRSVTPQAVDAVTALWIDADDDLKRRIVERVLQTADHRYTDLISRYTTTFLEQFTGENQSNKGGDAGSDLALLKELLGYLSANDDDQFSRVARDQLLQLKNPAVQDVVLTHILKTLSPGEKGLADAYIENRLQLLEEMDAAALRGSVILTALNTIRRFPDPRYTERLLAISQIVADSSTTHSEAFRAALFCSSEDQLRELIREFDSLEDREKSLLLPHLASIQFPGWMALAEKTLVEASVSVPANTDPKNRVNLIRQASSRSAAKRSAVSVLQRDGSLESVRIIARELELLVKKAEEAGKIESADFQLVSTMFSALQYTTLPDALRVLNRCSRSSLKQVADRAADTLRNHYANYFRTSPMQQLYSQIFELRNEGEYEKAVELYDQILQHEPFFASAFVSRGSLHMRLGNHEQAMRDLQRANELSPLNAVTESIMAIAEVRLGNVDKGIADGEAILKAVPDLQTLIRRDTIYNTACIYGRAIEVTKDEATRKKYMERGIELLHECIFRTSGFDDSAHLLNDADLNAFHEHPKWDELVRQVRINEEKTGK